MGNSFGKPAQRIHLLHFEQAPLDFQPLLLGLFVPRDVENEPLAPHKGRGFVLAFFHEPAVVGAFDRDDAGNVPGHDPNFLLRFGHELHFEVSRFPLAGPPFVEQLRRGIVAGTYANEFRQHKKSAHPLVFVRRHDFGKMFSKKLFGIVLKDFLDGIVDKDKMSVGVKDIDDSGGDIDDPVEARLQKLPFAPRFLKFAHELFLGPVLQIHKAPSAR